MPYTDENSYKQIGFISGLAVKEFAYNMPLSADGNYREMTLHGVDKDNHDNFLVFVDGVLFNKGSELKFGENTIFIDVRYIGENSRVVVFNRRTDESFYSYQKEMNKNVSGLEKIAETREVGNTPIENGYDIYLIGITADNQIKLHDRFILHSKSILSDNAVVENTSTSTVSEGELKVNRTSNYFEIIHRPLHENDYNILRFTDNSDIKIWDLNGRTPKT